MDDAAVAVAAVQAGAAVVRAGFGAALARVDKGAGDVATQADLDAEAAILDVLRRERPDDATLGEETGRRAPSGEAPSRRIWLIDPICGTRNYAVGTGPVAVNVALEADGEVAVAAVADPLGGSVWWATTGRAWQRGADGLDLALEPSAASGLVDVNLDAPVPSGRPLWSALLLADPDFRAAFHPRVVSSTLAVAWVATGSRAGYVTDGDLRGSVHFTAGIALCAAAGCTVTDLTGEPVGTGRGAVIGADAETNRRLVALVARHLA